MSSVAFLGLICWVIWTTTYLFPGAEVIAIAALAAAAADVVLSGRAPDIGGRVGGWLLAFAAVSTVAAATSIWLGRSIEELRDLAKLILIFLLVINATASGRRLKLLLTLTVILLVVFPARGAIAAYFSGGLEVAGRADWRGAFGNANALAAVLLLFLPFPYAWFRGERRPALKLLWAACVVLLSAAVIASKSRSGFLGFLVVVLWSVWSARERIRAIGVAFVIACCVLVFGPEGWRERMVTMTYGITGQPVPVHAQADIGNWRDRVVIWQAALKIIADRPLTGTGPGTFEEAHKRHQDYSRWRGGQLWREAHNAFLRIWAETGLFGLIAFLAMLGAVYQQGLRALRRVKHTAAGRGFEAISLEAGLIGLTAFLTTNIFNSFSTIWFLYMSLAVLILITRRCGLAANGQVPGQVFFRTSSLPRRSVGRLGTAANVRYRRNLL